MKIKTKVIKKIILQSIGKVKSGLLLLTIKSLYFEM